MRVLFLLFMTTFVIIVQAQTLDWVKRIGGPGWDAAYSLTFDKSYNIILTGSFRDTVDFDPGSNSSYLYADSVNYAFVAKFDPVGNFLFAKSYGGPGYAGGSCVTIDETGNIYISGTFVDSVNFDNGPGSFYQYSYGLFDFFILKLDSLGNFRWVKTLGGAGLDNAYSLAVNNKGDLFVTGEFSESVDFDPGAGVEIRISSGYEDIFLVCLDTAGNFQWVETTGNSLHDKGLSVTTDADGNPLLIGGFSETVDFNPGSGITNLTSTGWFDMFIQKLDTSGHLLWIKRCGGTGMVFGDDIQLDYLGNIITTGSFNFTADFDPDTSITSLISHGNDDIFILKLSPSGELIWAKCIGGTIWDMGVNLAIDSANNIYLTGLFYDSVDFDPGVAVHMVHSSLYENIFILKLDSAGNFKWVRSMGGEGSDRGLSIDVDKSGNVYTCGWFEGSVDFNPGSGSANFLSNGDKDIFIQKLVPCGSFDTTLIQNGINLTATISGATYQWINCLNGCVAIQGATWQSFTIELSSQPGLYLMNLKSNGKTIQNSYIVKNN